jgi:hypothetical protein
MKYQKISGQIYCEMREKLWGYIGGNKYQLYPTNLTHPTPVKWWKALGVWLASGCRVRWGVCGSSSYRSIAAYRAKQEEAI